MSDLFGKIKEEKRIRPKIWCRIADFVLDSPAAAVELKLKEFSDAAKVSEGSVINFVHSLGYEGFVEFKVAVAQANDFFNSTYAASSEDEFCGISTALTLALRDASASISRDEMERVARALLNCRGRVLVCGNGSSAKIAEMFAGYLLRIGVPAVATDGYELYAKALSKGDVMIAISYSGATEEVYSAIKAASSGGAFCAVFTSFESSKIARAADSVILMRISESENGEFPLIARMVQLAACDAVCSKIISMKRIEKNEEK